MKSIAHVRHTQWKSNRPVKVDLIVLEPFKSTFLDRFFPRKLREAKLDEFFNLCQGGMRVQEYSLKYTLLSQSAPSLVADLTDMVSTYLTGVSRLVTKEFCLVMLNDNIYISHLVVYAKKIEKEKLQDKIGR